MGFFSWLLCSILVVALVLLLFPFSFRMDFEVGERGARALFFFFKKKIYEAKKSWKEEEPSVVRRAVSVPSKEAVEPETKDSKSVDPVEDKPLQDDDKSEDGVESVAKQPEETTTEKMTAPAKDPVQLDEKKESVIQEPQAKNTAEPAAEKTAEPAAELAADDEKPAKKPKKEKRKLTDREFWTIVLTPELDGRAFRYLKNIFSSSLALFRVKFIDCFVEGIRMEYVNMGYAAALNAFLKTYPYVGAWDFRMDWCRDKELRAQGTITASINLLRIICFTLKTVFFAGILFLSFWRRRARVLKTNELPDVGFVRRKIIDVIVEE